MEELAEAIHRVDTGVNQSPGLEDKESRRSNFVSGLHSTPQGIL